MLENIILLLCYFSLLRTKVNAPKARLHFSSPTVAENGFQPDKRMGAERKAGLANWEAAVPFRRTDVRVAPCWLMQVQAVNTLTVP